MTTLKRGSSGADVKTLQGKLNLAQDGIFGPITEEAVRDFQKRKGLTVDGIVGAKTWAALGVVTAQKKAHHYRHNSALHRHARGQGGDSGKYQGRTPCARLQGHRLSLYYRP